MNTSGFNLRTRAALLVLALTASTIALNLLASPAFAGCVTAATSSCSGG